MQGNFGRPIAIVRLAMPVVDVVDRTSANTLQLCFSEVDVE